MLNVNPAIYESDDWIASRHLIIRVAWHAALIIAISYFSSEADYVLMILAFYINAVTWNFLGGAGLAHELFHRRVFKKKNVNVALFKVCNYLTWSNPVYFSRSHPFHHSNTFKDGDAEVLNIVDWRDVRVLLSAFLIDFGLMFRRIAYSLCNALGFEIYFKPVLKMKKLDIVNSNVLVEARKMLFFNFFFYVFLFLSFNSAALIAVFFASFTGTFLNRFLAESQHFGLKKCADEGPLFHSRTIILPKFLSFFYANMNYHAEHHLKPKVPFYNLPRFHQLLIQSGELSSCRLHDYFVYRFSAEALGDAVDG